MSTENTTTCNYCGSPLTDDLKPTTSTPDRPETEIPLDSFLSLYSHGKVQELSALIEQRMKLEPSLEGHPALRLLQAKALIEIDGGNGFIKNAIRSALARTSEDPEIRLYANIVEAKEFLDSSNKDQGEKKLRDLLKQVPNNPHICLLLGTYLFWIKRSPEEAQHFLERAVQIRPVLLRAWACLGATYDSTGNTQMAKRAFKKCLEFETIATLVSFYQSRVDE